MRLAAAAVRLLRDPLLWFVLCGGGLFVAHGLLSDEGDDYLIWIDAPLVQRLQAQWQGQAGRPPTEQEMRLLIDGYIREEIKIRQARRLGLEQGDVIIRRRLAQKLDFLHTESKLLPEPDPQQLRAFYAAHKDRYQLSPRYSFRHIFASDRSEAERLAPQVAASPQRWRQLGQPFMLHREYARLPLGDIVQLFGTEFADAVASAASDTISGQSLSAWSAPVKSSYGWHLIQVAAHHPPQQMSFEQAQDRVEADWRQRQRDEVAAEKWREMRSQYRVQWAVELEAAP